MLNKTILMGRLTKDPELCYTSNNIPVVNFTIAVERDYKGPDGKKETDFIDIVAWRNTAEFISRYFAKGRMIAVEGHLQTRKWTTSNGEPRKAVEVEVDNAYFADSSDNRGQTEYSYSDESVQLPDTKADLPY